MHFAGSGLEEYNLDSVVLRAGEEHGHVHLGRAVCACVGNEHRLCGHASLRRGSEDAALGGRVLGHHGSRLHLDRGVGPEEHVEVLSRHCEGQGRLAHEGAVHVNAAVVRREEWVVGGVWCARLEVGARLACGGGEVVHLGLELNDGHSHLVRCSIGEYRGGVFDLKPRRTSVPVRSGQGRCDRTRGRRWWQGRLEGLCLIVARVHAGKADARIGRHRGLAKHGGALGSTSGPSPARHRRARLRARHSSTEASRRAARHVLLLPIEHQGGQRRRRTTHRGLRGAERQRSVLPVFPRGVHHHAAVGELQAERSRPALHGRAGIIGGSPRGTARHGRDEQAQRLLSRRDGEAHLDTARLPARRALQAREARAQAFEKVLRLGKLLLEIGKLGVRNLRTLGKHLEHLGHVLSAHSGCAWEAMITSALGGPLEVFAGRCDAHAVLLEHVSLALYTYRGISDP
mmetsp:Transcript_15286/g.46664  ORF Transcript_15286/g.46664 Transcript_15286/m.46664 type:complete len:458 (-) Transcript_15286:363-1736(-)